ncbi:putative ribonuclease H-like domain-containing protein [Tanacetum coccineum]
MNHQTSSVPQIAYQSPQVSTQPMTELPLIDSGFAVPVFSQGDDPIACLNKAMAFLTTVDSLRFPSTNNQLRTSLNPRNQATIQDGRVTVQQVQGRQGQSYSGTGYKSNATSSGGNNASGQATVVKCYNCQGEGHMARQCTQSKRPRNAAWYKDKAMVAEAQEAGQILDEEQLTFLADPGIPDGQAVQTIIPNNAAFQTEDLDTYDFDCDDISNAKAVLMANISNYGSYIISEVSHSETYLNDMENQSVHAMQDFEHTPVVDVTDNEITSDSNIIPYSKYLQETQQANGGPSSFMNMGTPPKFQTPMRSQPGSSDCQRQMPEQLASHYWQPSPHPGSYNSFARVPSHMGRPNLQPTIDTQHDVDGIVDQEISVPPDYMPTTSRNTYGLHALLMTLEADIRTTNIILRTRQQLLRSISAKQNFVNNYMAI